MLCFRLFHLLSSESIGSEGISSTLGMCYALSSPASVTRWKEVLLHEFLCFTELSELFCWDCTFTQLSFGILHSKIATC